MRRLATYTLEGLGPAYAHPARLPIRSTNTTIRAKVSTLERGLSRLGPAAREHISRL